MGILDVLDCIHALLLVAYPELLQEGYVKTHKRLSMTELQAIGIDFSAQHIAGLVHGGDLWYRGDRESTLYEIVSSGFRVGLSTPKSSHNVSHNTQTPHLHHMRVHHRIAVFDILPGDQTPDGPVPEWRITNVVSQTDILRLLASHMGVLAVKDSAMGASLLDLGMVQGRDHMATVTADTPALSVLVKMHREKLSGVGVVGGEGGKLLANLSASDVRGLLPEKFGALALPVGTFLLLMHEQHVHRGGSSSSSSSKDRGHAHGITYEDALLDTLPPAVQEGGRWEEALEGLPPLLWCPPTATLRQCIELLVRQGKHRVYVCDEGGVGVGVVTPTDVLRAVVLNGNSMSATATAAAMVSNSTADLRV